MTEAIQPAATPARVSDEQRLYALVKERLLEGGYRGGERLVVAELAIESGVSRQPVYDALRRLSAEGFVEIVPRVGCRVHRHDLAEVRDFFELFAAVEGASAAMAARRCDEDDLRLLRRLNAQIGGLLGLEDGGERAHGYRLLNREFHSTVHRVGGTAIVDDVASGLYDRSDFLINGATPVSPLADSVAARHRDHQAIIARLEQGDEEGARAEATAHIRGTVPLIEATIAATAADPGPGAKG
jgi:DNA-binding GntR family transcriptional regulator